MNIKKIRSVNRFTGEDSGALYLKESKFLVEENKVPLLGLNNIQFKRLKPLKK